MITKKRNIELICKAMNWTPPTFCDAGAKGYLTWKKSTLNEIQEIEQKTGIKCSLTHNNRIIVPYYFE